VSYLGADALPGEAWSEPFLVNAVSDAAAWCADSDCEAEVRWQVEIIGWTGQGDEPSEHPVLGCCGQHLGPVMDRWT